MTTNGSVCHSVSTRDIRIHYVPHGLRGHGIAALSMHKAKQIISPAVKKGLTGPHRLLDYTPLRKREVSDTGLEMAVRMPLKI